MPLVRRMWGLHASRASLARDRDKAHRHVKKRGRACHVQTTGSDLPDRRMISAVPQPSAMARMMLRRGAVSHGNASIIWRENQTYVGFSITP